MVLQLFNQFFQIFQSLENKLLHPVHLEVHARDHSNSSRPRNEAKHLPRAPHSAPMTPRPPFAMANVLQRRLLEGLQFLLYKLNMELPRVCRHSKRSLTLTPSFLQMRHKRKSTIDPSAMQFVETFLGVTTQPSSRMVKRKFMFSWIVDAVCIEPYCVC